MATKGYYQRTVRNAAGAAVVGASVEVKELNGDSAVVENSNGDVLTQPLTTDSNGVFAFYVLFGSYDITVTNGGDVVPLPQQLVGPDQASLASAGSVIGQVALFATGVPLGDYILLDGASYSADDYPVLAPLMPTTSLALIENTTVDLPASPQVKAYTPDNVAYSATEDLIYAVLETGAVAAYNVSDGVQQAITATFTGVIKITVNDTLGVLTIAGQDFLELRTLADITVTLTNSLPTFSNEITAARVSNDGTKLAVSERNGGTTLRLFDTGDWSEFTITFSSNNNLPASTMEFSPDDTLLAVNNESFFEFYTFDVAALAGNGINTSPEDTVSAFAFSNTQLFVQNETDTTSLTSFSWTASGVTEQNQVLIGSGAVGGIAILPGSSFLFYVSQTKLAVIDPSDLTEVVTEVFDSAADAAGLVFVGARAYIPVDKASAPRWRAFDSAAGFTIPDVTAPDAVLEYRIRAL